MGTNVEKLESKKGRHEPRCKHIDADAESWQLPTHVSGVSVTNQVRLAVHHAFVLLICVEGVLMSLRESETVRT